jgi:hypothetical protein
LLNISIFITLKRQHIGSFINECCPALFMNLGERLYRKLGHEESLEASAIKEAIRQEINFGNTKLGKLRSELIFWQGRKFFIDGGKDYVFAPGTKYDGFHTYGIYFKKQEDDMYSVQRFFANF